jgi:hypothetical protein
VAASRPATATLAIAVVVVAVIGATAGVVISRRSAERVSGSVNAQRTRAGTFSFSVNDCASGQAFVPGFFGVDLRSREGYVMRVVDSGEGARLWLYPKPGEGGAIGISKPPCARWDVLVDWAHLTVNRVKTVSGHVHVDCAVGDGKVAADVTFERCAL